MKPTTTRSRFLAALPLLVLLAPAATRGQNAAAANPAAQPVQPAATAKPGQPVPRTPLVAPAPARSEWTVRMSSDFSAKWDTGDAPEPAAAAISQIRTVSSIQFSKDATSKTYRLHTRYSDGDGEDEWIVMGNHVAERAGHRGLYIVASESSIARDLSRADFPELAWVDMSCYRGLKTFKGKPAFVFSVPFDNKQLTGDQAQIMAFVRRSDAKATPSKIFKPKAKEVVLYLDAATQLPILYNDGLLIRRYNFNTPSEERLRPPAKILDFLRARNEALRKRLTPPAGPGTS